MKDKYGICKKEEKSPYVLMYSPKMADCMEKR